MNLAMSDASVAKRRLELYLVARGRDADARGWIDVFHRCELLTEARDGFEPRGGDLAVDLNPLILARHARSYRTSGAWQREQRSRGTNAVAPAPERHGARAAFHHGAARRGDHRF